MPTRRKPASAERFAKAAPRFRVAPGIAHRVVEGQVLVLGPDDHTLLTLNASGHLLWQQLVRGATAVALERALAATYGIDRDRARLDVKTFLDVLRRKRLIART